MIVEAQTFKSLFGDQGYLAKERFGAPCKLNKNMLQREKENNNLQYTMKKNNEKGEFQSYQKEAENNSSQFCTNLEDSDFEKDILTSQISSDLYDPLPCETELNKVRNAYNHLLGKVKSSKKELVSNIHETELLNSFINEADELYSHIKRPIDSVLDSKFLIYTADIGYQRLKKVPSSANIFSLDDFVDCAISAFSLNISNNKKEALNSEERLDFGKIGQLMEGLSAWRGVRVLKKHFAKLSLPRFQRQVKVKTKKTSTSISNSKEEEVELQVAQKVIQSEKMQERETTDYVVDVYTTLIDLGGSVNYYKFILNPSSFSRSVENMFYVSFLIRDDRVKLETIEEELVLSVLEEDSVLVSDNIKKQIIIELTVEKWTRLIEEYQIIKPLIN